MQSNNCNIAQQPCPVTGRRGRYAHAETGYHWAPAPWPLINTQPNSNAQPLRVVVTGAAGQIAYSLLFMVASGRMLGPYQPIILHLLDIAPALPALNGVVLELQDGAFPLLKGIVATADVKEAFSGADVVLMVGAFPRGPGMQRKDLLTKNAGIFKEQGQAISNYAAKHVKVVVVGNPANTNALTAMVMATDIPKQNFSALTRLDHNRAVAQVASKLRVGVRDVHNVIIWGNHSNTQYPDLNHSYVSNYPAAGVITPVRSAINDDEWIEKTFIPVVQQRGAAVIAARKLSSAASAANAIVDHMRSWLLGTRPKEIVSMAVASDGSYGVPEGLIYSFPVTCNQGSYKIVQGLPINGFSKSKLDATTAELIEERDTALTFLGLPVPPTATPAAVAVTTPRAKL